MATTEKKYLSLVGLQEYDAKIKAHIDAADEAALQAAKDYADGLADNYDAAGTAQTKVDELAEGQVKTNKEAIDAINDGTTGILAQAQAYADGKDQAIADAQAAADAAQEAADAAQDTVDELISGDVATMKSQIDSLIAGTYDDTEVRGLISDNADDIDTLEGRADAVEAQVATLVGDDADKSVRTIANEELAKQLIAENAAEALDSLEEIAKWIQDHPGDAAAMNAAIEALETLIGTIPEGVTATTIVGYIQEAVAAEKTRAEAAEDALDGRVATIEGNIGTGTVDSRIEAAKTAAATDAQTKADAALDSAKAYTDAEIDKIDISGINTNANAIAALTGRMDSAESDIDALEASLAVGGATANAIADAKKAGTDAQTAVTTLADGRVAGLEDAVDAVEGRLDTLESVTYVEITSAEIDAMFAA